MNDINLELVKILAVGVSDYSHMEYLEGPVNDVQNLQDLLVNSSSTAIFRHDQFMLISDPTSSELRDHINHLTVSNAGKKCEYLVFYFSGHGVSIGIDDYGFCTKDTMFYEGDVLPLSLVKFSDFIYTCAISNIIPIIIIDACYSGLVSRQLPISHTNLFTFMNKEITNRGISNYALLTSSGPWQISQDAKTGGIFSHYLIHFANEGDSSQKNKPLLSLGDLEPKIKRKVSSYTQGTTPVSLKTNILTEFPFVKNTKYSPTNYSFGPQLYDFLQYLWDNGNLRTLSHEEIRSAFKAGLYSNHKKLTYPVWGLTEYVPGEKDVIQLTSRGKNFCLGKESIPKRIIKDYITNEYIPDPNTSLIDKNSFSNTSGSE